MMRYLIDFCLKNKFITILGALVLCIVGFIVMPFDNLDNTVLPRSPILVDAFPNMSEKQQIVFTEWVGRSPQDVEDQVTYPLSIALQGTPGVKSIRSYSAFGFSTIYVIFNDDIDFYWSRSRILEKLNTASKDLPDGITSTLGPDATGLGQIFWYTLEGKGFGPEELRSIQDWYVKYALQSIPGVSEVASIGGFVKEYQIDVDPDAMQSYEISLQEVIEAVKKANIDVSAKTIELNNVEYMVRGIGFIKTLEDIENIVVKVNQNIPIYIKNISSQVQLGPALRRGVLNKSGTDVVGGVVISRFNSNPKIVIQEIKKRIKQIEAGFPTKTLEDGTVLKIKIVPFYDRTILVDEILDTLSGALIQQILITVIVISFFLLNLGGSLVVSLSLPMAILMTFILMYLFKVDANIMSLSGIVIAIGTIVDMSIVMCENIWRRICEKNPGKVPLKVVYEAAKEVGGAILTAILTTIISFLAVFTMTGLDGKLFQPLAYTKTFALLGSVLLSLTVTPVLSYIFLVKYKHFFTNKYLLRYGNWIIIPIILIFLSTQWRPLGFGKGFLLNFIFISTLILFYLLFFFKCIKYYPTVLMYCLANKKKFLCLPLMILGFGLTIWLGFSSVMSPIFTCLEKIGIQKNCILTLFPMNILDRTFPGLGKEFMPALDEGEFLYMPTTMPHASVGEVLDLLRKQNIRISHIPEVESVVGKMGRVDSALDTAPISMFETMIRYKSEYIVDEKTGKKKRVWRDKIKSQNDIWDEIILAGKIPGLTSAPRLQPIMARLVMLQSGMRSAMGVKISGKSLIELEEVGLQIESLLKEVPEIDPYTVIADRVVGKPYLEFDIDREKIARYGIHIADVQRVIEVAIGGITLTTLIDGRERYPIRVRYPREKRGTIEEIQKVLVPTRFGAQIPLSQLSKLNFVRGPQVIKSEDGFLVMYVIFDKKLNTSELNAVYAARNYLQNKIDSGDLVLPRGTNYKFAGSYENQVKSEKTLSIILPLSLLIILLILYFQFQSIPTTLSVFSGIAVAFCGGFILLWLYAQDWFMWMPFFQDYFRDIFNVRTYNLSVAVWIGFLALFGIASDDGVLIATYLNETFRDKKFNTIQDIRQAVLFAGNKRIRPCLMTTATTTLALFPILTSYNRGSNVMIPMALPSIGGMMVTLITILVVPTLYCWREERKLKKLLYTPYIKTLDKM